MKTLLRAKRIIQMKAEDKEHMADLFRRAGANADTEVTFRKVLESGEKIRL